MQIKFHRLHFSETSGIYLTSPDEDAIHDYERAVFSKVPWKGIHWKQFINKTVDKVKPLSVSKKTYYNLLVSPNLKDLPWSIHFFDGFSGKKYAFGWNGKGADERSIHIEKI